VPSPFALSVQYGETNVRQTELTVHNKPGFLKRAAEFAGRALSAPVGLVGLTDISGVELADASLRFSEDYSPAPDFALDAYGAAMRGVPTVFPPLVFSLTPKQYAKMISLPGIGEAIAGYILEEPAHHPDQLNLSALCRPLHSAPDLLMCYRQQPGRLAVVEAKASESQTATRQAILALAGVLPVFIGWRNSGNAIDAIGVGVSVDGRSSPAGPVLNVVIVKLVDPEGRVPGPIAPAGPSAIDALWAGDIGQGVQHLEALQETLSSFNAPEDQVSAVGSMRADANAKREFTSFREESDNRRTGELVVSDRVEARSYPTKASHLDLGFVARQLEQPPIRVTQRRRRSLVAIFQGIEVHIFWDGRVRVVGPSDQAGLINSVMNGIQKMLASST